MSIRLDQAPPKNRCSSWRPDRGGCVLNRRSSSGIQLNWDFTDDACIDDIIPLVGEAARESILVDLHPVRAIKLRCLNSVLLLFI